MALDQVLTVRVDRGLRERLEEMAVRRGLTLSALLNRAARVCVEKPRPLDRLDFEDAVRELLRIGRVVIRKRALPEQEGERAANQ
jgi:antitoxin component of RelBE/YafQ-DinJ toxin-antitoxin module